VVALEPQVTELHELAVEVPDEEVRRYLGYPRRRRPRPAVAQRLEELWPIGQGLLRPRGALRVVEATELAAAAMPRPTERVAVGLCTIGEELEQESDRRGAAGDPLGALILDAFGSAAAEATAEALSVRACALADALELRAERRISPGYGRWPVSAQPALLALLPRAQLGVSLSPGLMMIPRKSVSFAVRLHRKGAARRTVARSPCAACRKQPCPYRQGEDE
jgi:hypothetical protein